MSHCAEVISGEERSRGVRYQSLIIPAASPIEEDQMHRLGLRISALSHIPAETEVGVQA